MGTIKEVIDIMRDYRILEGSSTKSLEQTMKPTNRAEYFQI